MEQEYPYLRIGTAYYKIVQKPLASGDRMTLLLPWSVECIKQDHGKSYLSGIPKYDGFCFVPSHLHYKRFIGNFYGSRMGRFQNSHSLRLREEGSIPKDSRGGLRELIPILIGFYHQLISYRLPMPEVRMLG